MSRTDLHKLPPARLTRRLIAGVYDWLLVIAIMMVISVPLVALRNDAVAPGDNLYRVVLFVVAAAFFAGFWSRGGQTLGMRAWRLRLINTDGSDVTLRTALLRYAYAWVSLLPAGLGFWWALIARDTRTWHDRWSGTRLVETPQRERH